MLTMIVNDVEEQFVQRCLYSDVQGGIGDDQIVLIMKMA